jgi:hypothetical protein
MSTYDSWLTEPPAHFTIYHDREYPTGYTCTCGGDEWWWDADALGWMCACCGDFLDAGDYPVLSPDEADLEYAGL